MASFGEFFASLTPEQKTALRTWDRNHEDEIDRKLRQLAQRACGLLADPSSQLELYETSIANIVSSMARLASESQGTPGGS